MGVRAGSSGLTGRSVRGMSGRLPSQLPARLHTRLDRCLAPRKTLYSPADRVHLERIEKRREGQGVSAVSPLFMNHPSGGRSTGVGFGCWSKTRDGGHSCCTRRAAWRSWSAEMMVVVSGIPADGQAQ